ncbi:putative hydro-lyase [Pseudomonas gingeri]|uniref:putative hydro-lyase n=1 Tax=Pseudomonas gingeri TaxID=117681 RepID=UPI0015A1CA03|nr:putative hydro-lyase [Pseudomonas gingeri]NWD06141.1 putative hydro-lyase [Pseudomonas gingeri]NWE32753.1 putative hydro-lyase [Pseudomonas gingeri]NWE55183.1 putative hydro-lyase [Pseudomonas gingeri]NWF03201.1 putative hydro-lyase [Pseudomonas gingeri]
MNQPVLPFEQLRHSTPFELRQQIAAGRYQGHTSGLGQGRVQANIVILPGDWADEFLRFCTLNRQACPLLDVTEPGDPILRNLGQAVDIRHDVPRYRVYREGVLSAEPLDIAALWQDDLVAFAIGCSFSFEQPLLDAGIDLRHIERGLNVAMYQTDIDTRPTARLQGKLVVSMRPLKAAAAIRAIQITGRMPNVHGAPVHIGDPALIGIRDLATPDYGDAVPVAEDEIPVFWACGVTPQSVVQASRPPLCITHAPGCMLVTDLHNHTL